MVDNKTTGGRAAAEVMQRIADSPSNLVLLDAADADELVENLRILARRTGQALYLWTDDGGLHSLREGGAGMPVSNRLSDALRFIRRSMHFGIYLLRTDIAALTPHELGNLAALDRLEDGPARRVVLFGRAEDADPQLASACMRLRVTSNEEARPRLRDGQWVR